MTARKGKKSRPMIRLKPQHIRQSYWKEIEDQLKVYFYEEVLKPIVAIMVTGTTTLDIVTDGTLAAFPST